MKEFLLGEGEGEGDVMRVVMLGGFGMLSGEGDELSRA